ASHEPRLRHRARQRLLAVEMPSALQCRHRSNRMGVIGCGNNNGINVILIHELSEVIVGLRSGKSFGGSGEIVIVHIAESDDVFTVSWPLAEVIGAIRYAVKIIPSPAGDPDHTDIQLFVR